MNALPRCRFLYLASRVLGRGSGPNHRTLLMSSCLSNTCQWLQMRLSAADGCIQAFAQLSTSFLFCIPMMRVADGLCSRPQCPPNVHPMCVGTERLPGFSSFFSINRKLPSVDRPAMHEDGALVRPHAIHAIGAIQAAYLSIACFSFSFAYGQPATGAVDTSSIFRITAIVSELDHFNMNYSHGRRPILGREAA